MLLLHWPYEIGQVILLSILLAHIAWSTWTARREYKLECEDRARYAREFQQRLNDLKESLNEVVNSAVRHEETVKV